MSQLVETMYCPECHDERPVVQPPCPDGHEGDCPEWVCLEFGHAFWSGRTPESAPLPRRTTIAA